jgi:hypothetical protein
MLRRETEAVTPGGDKEEVMGEESEHDAQATAPPPTPTVSLLMRDPCVVAQWQRIGSLETGNRLHVGFETAGS